MSSFSANHGDHKRDSNREGIESQRLSWQDTRFNFGDYYSEAKALYFTHSYSFMYQEDSEHMYFGVVLSTANPSPVPENSTVESRNLSEQANHLNFSFLLSIAWPVVSRENNVTSTDERTLLSSIIVLGDEGMNQGKEMACVYVCA